MAKERHDVPEHLKWRVEDIFETLEDFEKAYKEVEGKLDFSSYEGKLADAQTLLECFEKLNEVSLTLSHLSVYAFMRHDEDTRDDLPARLQARVDRLGMKLSGNTSFITPELTALPMETLEAFANDARFADYDYSIRGIMKNKPHVLSKETEAVLSQGGRTFRGCSQVFSMLDNADFPTPTISVKGKKTEVTHGTYGVLLQSSDRRVRKAAFKAYYKAYIGLINTITAAFVGNIEKDLFFTKVRHYPSCLARALSGEDVDVRVYENLLASVEQGLPLLHRYFADKKKMLGYREMHMYDVYVSTVENADIQVDYEEAYRIVTEGLTPLGEEYAQLLKRAHDERWIDVEETVGKRNGAYSISVHGLKHPYVLLNYQKTTNNVFTIAHELGHAMHSYYSEKNQPQEKSGYTLFVAEVASTVNEILLIKHLLKKTEDKKLRKYLLSYYIDTLKGTLFRQTQFAEFEFTVHDMAEKGIPLTRDSLCQKYLELNKKYYGDAVVSDDEIAYEWARIPHLYRNFYVYKYATGIITAVSIAERIEKEGKPAVNDYFKFLSSGGSDSPVELLKLAGVDLTKMDAFDSCMASFEKALSEFEAIEE